MADEQSYFLNERVVRCRHVYKHIWTPGIDEALLVEKESRNLYDKFRYFHGEEQALCQRLFTALNTPPAII